MAGKTSVFQKLLDEADLCDESLPRQPVVELLGDGRVLIENHQGVTAYCSEMIQVGVHYGTIGIRGCNLRLRLMTNQKLVIVGQINGIDVLRGKRK